MISEQQKNYYFLDLLLKVMTSQLTKKKPNIKDKIFQTYLILFRFIFGTPYCFSKNQKKKKKI